MLLLDSQPSKISIALSDSSAETVVTAVDEPESSEATALVLTVAPPTISAPAGISNNASAAAELKDLSSTLTAATAAPQSPPQPTSAALTAAGVRERARLFRSLVTTAAVTTIGAGACFLIGAAAGRVHSLAVVAPVVVMASLVAASVWSANSLLKASIRSSASSHSSDSANAAAVSGASGRGRRGARGRSDSDSRPSAHAPAPASTTASSAAAKDETSGICSSGGSNGVSCGVCAGAETFLVLVPFAGFVATLVTETIGWFALSNALAVAAAVAVRVESAAAAHTHNESVAVNE